MSNVHVHIAHSAIRAIILNGRPVGASERNENALVRDHFGAKFIGRMSGFNGNDICSELDLLICYVSLIMRSDGPPFVRVYVCVCLCVCECVFGFDNDWKKNKFVFLFSLFSIEQAKTIPQTTSIGIFYGRRTTRCC